MSSGGYRPPDHWIGAFAEWWKYGLSPQEALVSLMPDQMRTHVAIVGATGSGKTTLLHHLIAQLIRLLHSFVVFDFRGDLVQAVVEMCAGRVPPERVKILDLRERHNPLGYDPLSGPGELYVRALQVLEVITKLSDSFGVQLAETLRYALLLLAEAGRPLTELERVLTDSDWREACLRRSRDENVQTFWGRFGGLSPDKQLAMVMPVLNKVSMLFATTPLRKILGHQMPVDLGRHLNKPGSILLISLAGEELFGAGRMMGNLVLSSICRELFARVGIAEKDRNPVQLIVDECQNFPGTEFEMILAEGRRFKASLVLATQTLGQFTPSLRSLILNSVGTKIAFRCGRDDGSTISRDLTGDSKAIDFARFPVGRAAMWQADTGAVEIEVNAPIFKSVGELSSEGHAYLADVYRLSHPQGVRVRPKLEIVTPTVVGPTSETDEAPEPLIKEPKLAVVRPVPPTSLEDWLWN